MMSRRELDELYFGAEARTPPRGTTHGTVIAGWREIAYGAAVMVSALWRGKVFDYSMTETEGLVINRITPFGLQCVIGRSIAETVGLTVRNRSSSITRKPPSLHATFETNCGRYSLEYFSAKSGGTVRGYSISHWCRGKMCGR
jgi:hypothetical protein